VSGRAGLLLRTPGRIGWDEAWAAQRALHAARLADAIPDVVWLLEHEPVYTTGRHGRRGDLWLSDEALTGMGAVFRRADRGGQMTWHGPGQTTGYVIADLRGGPRVRPFVEALVGAMADAAGLDGAGPDPEAMGLYRDGRKLGSVGIRVGKGVSTHGIALNRDPELTWFAAMTACGQPGVAATSIAAEGGDPGRERVEAELAEALATRLGLALTEADLADLVRATAA
jgi:lipoyl(octanoyl) transferase